jgi:hypothetical protein
LTRAIVAVRVTDVPQDGVLVTGTFVVSVMTGTAGPTTRLTGPELVAAKPLLAGTVAVMVSVPTGKLLVISVATH